MNGLQWKPRRARRIQDLIRSLALYKLMSREKAQSDCLWYFVRLKSLICTRFVIISNYCKWMHLTSCGPRGDAIWSPLILLQGSRLTNLMTVVCRGLRECNRNLGCSFLIWIWYERWSSLSLWMCMHWLYLNCTCFDVTDNNSEWFAMKAPSNRGF